MGDISHSRQIGPGRNSTLQESNTTYGQIEKVWRAEVQSIVRALRNAEGARQTFSSRRPAHKLSIFRPHHSTKDEYTSQYTSEAPRCSQPALLVLMRKGEL